MLLATSVGTDFGVLVKGNLEPSANGNLEPLEKGNLEPLVKGNLKPLAKGKGKTKEDNEWVP